jgi:hypothetical protein
LEVPVNLSISDPILAGLFEGNIALVGFHIASEAEAMRKLGASCISANIDD